MERRNVISIERARAPTNQTELGSFLAMCNVYRRFVQGFSKIAAPLNKKTSKNQPYEFSTLIDTEYAAFEELKRCLVSPTFLALPATDGNIRWTPTRADTKWVAPFYRSNPKEVIDRSDIGPAR